MHSGDFCDSFLWFISYIDIEKKNIVSGEHVNSSKILRQKGGGSDKTSA